MSILIDLTGNIYGRLTVICQVENTKEGRARWKCRCDCGNEKDIPGKDLRRGNIKSCGCLRREASSSRKKTHGASESRLYYIWLTMKQRCNNPNNHKARDYRNRGITICSEWNEFEEFQKWALANGYADNLTIDRIDNDGNYEPKNCRWATAIEQGSNKRNNVNITFDGKIKNIAQWAREYGLKHGVVQKRIKYLGWSIEKALTTPARKRVVV